MSANSSNDKGNNGDAEPAKDASGIFDPLAGEPEVNRPPSAMPIGESGRTGGQREESAYPILRDLPKPEEKRERMVSFWKPSDLRSPMCGSAIHIRKAATSRAYWSAVCGVPSV